MSKKKFFIIFSIIIILILMVGVYFKGNVQTAYSAKIYPLSVSQVKALAEGKVKNIYVQPDDNVIQGQVILEIETTPKDTIVKNSKTVPDLIQVRNNLNKAEENYKNAALMYKDGVITQEDYDNRLSNLKRAQDAYKDATFKSKKNQQALSIAQKSLIKVISPIDGVIDEAFVKVGDNVNVGDNLFVVSHSDMKVTAYVDKKTSLNIKEGQSVLITVPEYDGRKFNGAVDYIESNPVSVQNKSDLLYPVVISFDAKIDSSVFKPAENASVIFLNSNKSLF